THTTDSASQPTRAAGNRPNGGHLRLRNDGYRYNRGREELHQQPFQRLIHNRRLVAYKYNGFWACMDTFKEKQTLDDMFVRGEAPWEVWRSAQRSEVEFSNV